MSSSVKIISQLSLLGVILLISIYHSMRNSEYAGSGKERNVEPQVFRYRRAIQSTTRYCRPNQYYDQKEGKCLGVPGGGKVLHVENRRSCGINILKPHCKSPSYYYICKSGKSILAQCSSNQIFDNRHQRCVYYDTSKLTPSTIRPDDRQHYDHMQVPNCTKPGQFPVPDQCSMFYSCESNGHRLYQSVFKCPQNTGYQVDKGTCAVSPNCKNDNSVDSKVCVSDAPKEIIESPNINEATEQNIETTSERVAETTGINDSLVRREENENTYTDIVSTTPVVREYNNTDTDNTLNSNVNSSTQSAEEASLSDNTDGTTIPQTPRSTESTQEALDETQKENDSSLGMQITSPATLEFDNDALHSTVTFVTSTEYSANNMNTNVDSETADTALFSSVSYTSPELDDRTHDATTVQYRNDDQTEADLNSSTETSDPHLASTVSTVTEFSSLASTQLDDETQNITTERYTIDNDVTIPNLSTETIEPHLISTVSDIPESYSVTDTQLEETQSATTVQYRNDDRTEADLNSSTETSDPHLASTVSTVSEFSSLASTQLDDETQNITTERYTIDNDVTIPNLSTIEPHLISTVSDIPESFSVTDMQLEETQSATTVQYRNDDRTEANLNSSTETSDPHLASTVSTVSEFSSLASTQLDDETQNITTERYTIDNDVTIPNLSTIEPHLISTVSDIPESFSVTDMQLEETQSATTEQYKDNRAATLPNFTTEMISQGLTSEVNDVPATTSNPYGNTTTSASDIVSQKPVDVNEHTTEELAETTFSIDSKSVDSDLRETGEITTQYLHENTDNVDLAATTIVTFILRHTTTPMDSATVTPMIQDIPAVSDADLVTQNSTGGKSE